MALYEPKALGGPITQTKPYLAHSGGGFVISTAMLARMGSYSGKGSIVVNTTAGMDAVRSELLNVLENELN